MYSDYRLLVVVRDPVTRAISDYTQAASKKLGMKKFEELAFSNGSYSINISLTSNMSIEYKIHFQV